MTIKEIEERCGIPRANIRYYETEGLLTPARGANGYRDYSEADLDTLLKIKLLRSVHISLEDIKALQAGEEELTKLLNRHLQTLIAEQKELEWSEAVCTVMCDEGAKYGTLNAQRYLDYMQQSLKEESVIYGNEAWKADVVSKAPIPWRRFFARSLDISIYSAFWNIFLMCVCNINVMLQINNVLFEIAEIVVVIALMLVTEPVLLSVFGTTMGKWAFGLYVTDLEGEKPRYQDCRKRTLQVVCYGLGWCVPVYHWVRLYKSYKSCLENRDLEWEYRSNVLSKGEEIKYIVRYVLGCAVVVVMLYAGNLYAILPQNRGNITTAEFCENFNRLAAYYGLFEERELLESGEWLEEENDAVMVAYLTENAEGPQFIFTKENGILTGIGFQESFILPPEQENQLSPFGVVSFYQQEMAMAVLAFLPAQESYPFYSHKAQEIAAYILENSYQDFEIEAYGVKISYDLEYTNFENMKQQGYLIKLDDSVEARCSMTFLLELQ